MKIHIAFARLLIRLGSFLQSSAIMVMPTSDLVEFSRQHYARPSTVDSYDETEIISRGLLPPEEELLEQIPIREGRLLVLGVGGGREAIPLAQMGFEVTGVDFILEMIQRAVKNAEKSKVKIEVLVQEISNLEMPAGMYDVIWLSAEMYSCFPTRLRRIKMLQRVRDALMPGGYFACQFQWDSLPHSSRLKIVLRKLLAWLTLGNLTYEPGDMLWGNLEFIHQFSSENELVSEFTQAGFQVSWLNLPNVRNLRGQALLQKPV
jgi:2-polyprenyl-3-methyl-5-hydroxy-6-metoxy-1,4-benzoquinol methylase